MFAIKTSPPRIHQLRRPRRPTNPTSHARLRLGGGQPLPEMAGAHLTLRSYGAKNGETIEHVRLAAGWISMAVFVTGGILTSIGVLRGVWSLAILLAALAVYSYVTFFFPDSSPLRLRRATGDIGRHAFARYSLAPR